MMQTKSNLIFIISILLIASTLALVYGLNKRDSATFARIIFFGDSITRAGDLPNGYVSIVRESLKREYSNYSIDVIASGIDGNKVPNLQSRLKTDVLAKRPTHVVIYIGVNDVWHFYDSRKEPGTGKKEFEQGLRDLITQIQNAGSEVLLCTPSVIGEDPNSDTPVNQVLMEYADISRNVAKTSGIYLCDLRSAFEKYLQTNNPNQVRKGILTFDGVHLNDEGNRFVADFMLEQLRPLLNSQTQKNVN
jgi:lysophospholipase L1-like esterase